MIRRSSLYATIIFLSFASVACSKTPAAKAPEPVNAFEATLALAERRVAAGDYTGADRILADFALKSKGSEDGTEVAFFRAMYMVDPSNRTASMAEGIRALDIYLNTDGATRYRAQARVLRRTAQTVLSLRNAQVATHVVGRDTVFVSREDEITALKDQLAKANAELERIKKRLANPSR